MEIRPTSADTGSAGIVTNTPPAQDAPVKKNGESAQKPPPAESASLTPEQIKQMAEEIQEQLSSMSISLNFTPYGEHKEKMAIIVTDKESGKVIREIPPKEIQDLYVKMGELIGIIFNRRI